MSKYLVCHVCRLVMHTETDACFNCGSKQLDEIVEGE